MQAPGPVSEALRLLAIGFSVARHQKPATRDEKEDHGACHRFVRHRLFDPHLLRCIGKYDVAPVRVVPMSLYYHSDIVFHPTLPRMYISGILWLRTYDTCTGTLLKEQRMPSEIHAMCWNTHANQLLYVTEDHVWHCDVTQHSDRGCTKQFLHHSFGRISGVTVHPKTGDVYLCDGLRVVAHCGAREANHSVQPLHKFDVYDVRKLHLRSGHRLDEEAWELLVATKSDILVLGMDAQAQTAFAGLRVLRAQQWIKAPHGMTTAMTVHPRGTGYVACQIKTGHISSTHVVTLDRHGSLVMECQLIPAGNDGNDDTDDANDTGDIDRQKSRGLFVNRMCIHPVSGVIACLFNDRQLLVLLPRGVSNANCNTTAPYRKYTIHVDVSQKQTHTSHLCLFCTHARTSQSFTDDQSIS